MSRVLTVVIKRLLCLRNLGSRGQVLACSEVSGVEGEGATGYLHSQTMTRVEVVGARTQVDL